MHIIFIRNLKNRLILSGSLICFWIVMILLSGLILNKNIYYTIKLTDYLNFSYPSDYKISDIFVNNHFKKSEIETGSALTIPVAQQFSSFSGLEGKFSFEYPSSFTLSQQYFNGSEIIFHIDFLNKSKTVHGFIQVWNLPFDLKEFLNKSKSVSQQNFTSFTSEQMTFNKLPGFHWEYTVLNSDGKVYRGNEVFIKKDDNMYRVSYFIENDKWNEDDKAIFWKMVSSLKIK